MITSDFTKSLAIGSPAPDFCLRWTRGGEVRLSGHPGPAVVFFTCNHCPYVIGWEGRVQALATEFAGRVAWFGINANDAARYPDDSFARMTERERKGLPYVYLHDPTQEVAHAWGAQVTPEFFVLDAQHRVAYHGRLDASHSNPAAGGANLLREALVAVLEGRQPQTAEASVEGCSVKWLA